MRTVKNTVAENFGGAAHKLAPAEHQFDMDTDIPELSGKVAVATGGSEGIGYAACFCMFRAGLVKLFILSMSQEKFDGAVKDISEKLGPEYAQKATFLQCDISDLPAVAKIARDISSQTDRIDILLLNAARGIMTYQLTDYGTDRHFAANHIGHVVLTSHLPLLKQTAEKNTCVSRSKPPTPTRPLPRTANSPQSTNSTLTLDPTASTAAANWPGSCTPATSPATYTPRTGTSS
jgi:NAD(P)-dependent dehydrogenase (short-subunit alcohol dehydrogenase family)